VYLSLLLLPKNFDGSAVTRPPPLPPSPPACPERRSARVWVLASPSLAPLQSSSSPSPPISLLLSRGGRPLVRDTPWSSFWPPPPWLRPRVAPSSPPPPLPSPPLSESTHEGTLHCCSPDDTNDTLVNPSDTLEPLKTLESF
jgi:hypothetical protein